MKKKFFGTDGIRGRFGVERYILESALEAGISSAGMDVVMLGPVPTPAIAYLTRSARATAGIVISASHNAFHDNGIKFFSNEGFKLSREWCSLSGCS